MENASKALIIAGAILLAILIISLGIMVLNQGKDIIGGSGMSKAQIQAFNSTFTQYEGSKKGSEVRSLIQEVIASNALEENKDAERKVSLTLNGSEIIASGAATATGTSAIKNTASYEVTFNYNNGLVSEINVTDNAGSNP